MHSESTSARLCFAQLAVQRRELTLEAVGSPPRCKHTAAAGTDGGGGSADADKGASAAVAAPAAAQRTLPISSCS